jgi:hypothetical protein
MTRSSQMMKNDHTFRGFTSYEREIIDRLLEKAFPGRDEIWEQMQNCLVRAIDEDKSLEFLVKSKVQAKVKRRIPVEAEFQDSDGVLMHLLLHVVDGKVNELEIYKEDGSPIIERPDPSKLKIVCLD